jgi:hypothetical protein
LRTRRAEKIATGGNICFMSGFSERSSKDWDFARLYGVGYTKGKHLLALLTHTVKKFLPISEIGRQVSPLRHHQPQTSSYATVCSVYLFLVCICTVFLCMCVYFCKTVSPMSAVFMYCIRTYPVTAGLTCNGSYYCGACVRLMRPPILFGSHRFVCTYMSWAVDEPRSQAYMSVCVRAPTDPSIVLVACVRRVRVRLISSPWLHVPLTIIESHVPPCACACAYTATHECVSLCVWIRLGPIHGLLGLRATTCETGVSCV